MPAYIIPSNAALIFAIVPLNTIEASEVPSPLVNERPVVCDKVSVPWVTLSVTVCVPPSVSVMLIELLPPLLKVRDASSLTLCAPGTVFTGTELPLPPPPPPPPPPEPPPLLELLPLLPPLLFELLFVLSYVLSSSGSVGDESVLF